MRFFVSFSRLLVGSLFIFSGFVKLNDPLGFSYKLEEYFSSGVLDLPALIPYALELAVFLVIFEILLGVALLLGYAVKFTAWCLLLMILFFSFLTFYSAYFNKVTDCGCFGDAIPLNPWESFIKDIILLAFILLLFFNQKRIIPLFHNRSQLPIVVVIAVVCGWFANRVLNHLPLLDFRPYKAGVNISESMAIPQNAPSPIFEYQWKFEKTDGTQYVIVSNGQYPNTDDKYIGVETTLVKEGYIPPIHDFSIEKNGVDYTDQFLNTEKLIVVVSYDLEKADKEALEKIDPYLKKAKEKGYQIIGLTASNTQNSVVDVPFYFCDETTLKTIVRSNPGVLKLSNGTIKQKLHYNDIEDLSL